MTSHHLPDLLQYLIFIHTLRKLDLDQSLGLPCSLCRQPAAAKLLRHILCSILRYGILKLSQIHDVLCQQLRHLALFEIDAAGDRYNGILL